MLWGVERIYGAARESQRRLRGECSRSAWRSCCSRAFPESAYLGGLLALAWTVHARGATAALGLARLLRDGIFGRRHRGHGDRIAPGVRASFDYLGSGSDIGDHDASYATEAMNIIALRSIPSLHEPYRVRSAIRQRHERGASRSSSHIWGGIGGFVTTGAAPRRRRLRILGEARRPGLVASWRGLWRHARQARFGIRAGMFDVCSTWIPGSHR